MAWTSNFFTMPVATDGSANGTPVEVSQELPSGANDDYPSWAPAAPGSQNRIIFDSTRGGGQPELYTEDIDSPGSVAPVFKKTQTQTFSDTEPVYDPSNANEIAFVRTSGSGKSQIYTYNFASHALINLSAADGDENSNDSKPDFAPSPGNGSGVQVIVFQSDRPTPNALEWSVRGHPALHHQRPGRIGDQAGLPTVDWFTPLQTDGAQVCATSKDSVQVATGAKVAVENPVFSPDGTQIAFDQLASPQDRRHHPGRPHWVLRALLGRSRPDQRLGRPDPELRYRRQAPSWASIGPSTGAPEIAGCPDPAGGRRI